jgi:hypothetical protein
MTMTINPDGSLAAKDGTNFTEVGPSQPDFGESYRFVRG